MTFDLPRLSVCWLPAAGQPPEMCTLRTHLRVKLPSAGGILSRLSQGDDMFLQKLLIMFKVAKTATKLKSG